jgi:hypothetical protein
MDRRRVSAAFRVRRIAFVGFLLAVASGCGGPDQREYVWTRPEPAIGRGSPTTFVVRISVDSKSKSVVWFEDAHDSDGDVGRNTQTWDDCKFLDDNNWQCETGVPNQIEMRDGRLIQQYWGEQRNFVLRRKIFGMNF